MVDMPATPYLGKYLRDRYEDLDAEKTAGLEARFKKILEKRAEWWNPFSWGSAEQPAPQPAAVPAATPAPTQPAPVNLSAGRGIGHWLGDMLGSKMKLPAAPKPQEPGR